MSIDRQATLRVRTPEGIAFEFLLGGPVARGLAWLVDGCCVMLILLVVSVGLGPLGLIHADLARALMILCFFVVQVGYGVGLEWFWRGQTVGKRFLQLRVVDAQGLPLQFSQVLVRNLVRFVDFLPGLYGVGGAACLLSRRSQRLGDLAANTLVVRTPRMREPDAEQLAAGKYNSLRSHPHLVARLRGRVAPSEVRVALQAVLRRDELESNARIELFGEIAAHFASLIEFPPETREGVTDEQFVRNVVERLCRPERARAGQTVGDATMSAGEGQDPEIRR